jgi:hypothetical protein
MVKLGKPAHPERYRSRHNHNGREITNIRARKNLAPESRGCAIIILGVCGTVIAGVAAVKGWA